MDGSHGGFSCTDVIRVYDPEGLGMPGFLLPPAFHPLGENIVWKCFSCLGVMCPLVEVNEHQAATHFGLGFRTRLPRAGELSCHVKDTLPSTSPLCFPSQLETPAGPGRAGMEGQSGLE